MLASAESREEQILALQIALGEKLRQLRERSASPSELQPIQQALEQLRDGQLERAIRGLETGGNQPPQAASADPGSEGHRRTEGVP